MLRLLRRSDGRSIGAVGLILALVLSLLLGACVTDSLPEPPPRPDAVVGEGGFTVVLEGVTVEGPPGVASAGTGVHITPAPDLVPRGIEGVESGAAFDISLEGGAQPQAPVTVWFALPKNVRDHSALFFLTKRSDTGRWEGLPVTVVDGRASVTLTHFSGGWFGWGDKVRDWFIDQVKQSLKVGFPKPDCVGKSARLRGRDFEVSADTDGVYACVSGGTDALTTTIHSATPFVWRFRPTPGEGVGQQGHAPLELAGIATMALFDAMQDYSHEAETVLVPGGTASIKVKSGVTDTYTGARVDAGLGLVAVLVAGLDMAAAMASGQTPETWLETALKGAENADNIRQAAECMAGLFEESMDVGGRLGQIGNTVLSCTGTLMGELTEGFISGVVGVAVGIVTSLVGLLVTQVWGLIGEFTGQNEVRMHIASRAVVVPSPRAQVPAMTLRTYSNARYGYSCRVPEGWAQQESDNGDGITVTRPDGLAKVLCWGGYHDDGIEEQLGLTLTGFDEDGYQITYKNVTDDTITISGIRSNEIAYQRIEISTDTYAAIRWQYPAREMDSFDSAVSEAAAGLR